MSAVQVFASQIPEVHYNQVEEEGVWEDYTFDDTDEVRKWMLDPQDGKLISFFFECSFLFLVFIVSYCIALFMFFSFAAELSRLKNG